MTDGQEQVLRQPEFIYEQGMNPDDEKALRKLEAVIMKTPDLIQRALAVIAGREEGVDGVEAEAEKVPYEDFVRVATSRRGGPEFDPATEEYISASGAMKAVQLRRKANQGNPIAEQRDAAEVRHTRLELFVGRAAQYKEQEDARRQTDASPSDAEVVQMPEPREPARRTRTRSRSA